MAGGHGRRRRHPPRRGGLHGLRRGDDRVVRFHGAGLSHGLARSVGAALALPVPSRAPASSAPACRCRSTTLTRQAGRSPSRCPGCQATAPPSQQQGDLLVNPGGPGGSGLSLAAFVADGLSPQVAADYNIIGFDPRGVGSSQPGLTCDPAFFSGERPDYVPASAAAEQTLINRAKSYAADCEKRYGWLLPYMTSVDAARDMNSIRAALGVPAISYFAYSYGTYLGQVYATLFPHRLHRMVLDSTVDPTGAWYADNIAQDYAFEGRMEAFFAWVAAHNATYRLGSYPGRG